MDATPGGDFYRNHSVATFVYRQVHQGVAQLFFLEGGYLLGSEIAVASRVDGGWGGDVYLSGGIAALTVHVKLAGYEDELFVRPDFRCGIVGIDERTEASAVFPFQFATDKGVVGNEVLGKL